MKKVNESVAEEAARSESTELFLITNGWPIAIQTTKEKLDSINSQVHVRVRSYSISYIANGIIMIIITKLN